MILINLFVWSTNVDTCPLHDGWSNHILTMAWIDAEFGELVAPHIHIYFFWIIIKLECTIYRIYKDEKKIYRKMRYSVHNWSRRYPSGLPRTYTSCVYVITTAMCLARFKVLLARTLWKNIAKVILVEAMIFRV